MVHLAIIPCSWWVPRCCCSRIIGGGGGSHRVTKAVALGVCVAQRLARLNVLVTVVGFHAVGPIAVPGYFVCAQVFFSMGLFVWANVMPTCVLINFTRGQSLPSATACVSVCSACNITHIPSNSQ